MNRPYEFYAGAVLVVTSGYGPRTAEHLWFDRIIRRTPQGSRAIPVRAPCGPRTGIFNISYILRDPYGASAGPAKVPYGAQPEFANIPHGRFLWPHGARTDPLRSPQGLFTGRHMASLDYSELKVYELLLTWYAGHKIIDNGPLTRYVKFRLAHAPGMSGTFSPPPTSKETAS